MLKTLAGGTYKMARRVVIAVVGVTLLVFGAIMLVTPGPGIVAIAGGLAVLALEFAWAKLWLASLRKRISETAGKMRDKSINSHRS